VLFSSWSGSLLRRLFLSGDSGAASLGDPRTLGFALIAALFCALSNRLF
jgi:hypothetical protein